MLKLKFQYFGNLIQRADSLEKTLMLGKTESKKKRRQQRMRGLDCTTASMDMSLSKLREIVKNRKAWCAAFYRLSKSQIWLSDWTTTQKALIRYTTCKYFLPCLSCLLNFLHSIFWCKIFQNLVNFNFSLFLLLPVLFILYIRNYFLILSQEDLLLDFLLRVSQ